MNQDRSPTKPSRLARLAGSAAPLLSDVISLVSIRTPDAPQLIRRIQLMERNIILPLKVAVVVMLLQAFYSSPWMVIV